MRALLNFSLLCGYGVCAVAVAVFGPQWVPALGPGPAYGLGVAVLLAGILLHEMIVRARRQAVLGARMSDLNRAFVHQRDEAATLRLELAGLREALQYGVEGARTGRSIDEVMAEVKVLKSLLERLSPEGVLAPPPVAPPPALAAPPSDPVPSQPADQPPVPAGPAPEDGPALVVGLEPDAVLDIVRQALRNDWVDLALQPIVSLPQRKRRYYECFSRLRTADGSMIVADQYIALAERAGLITAVDNMLLFRCVQVIRKMHRQSRDVGFFCNISSHTIADEDFFKDFVEFLESNEDLAGHLVFEFAQADFARWSGVGARLLDRLALLGCRFSLDQVEDLDLDPALLAERRVRFIKVEAGLLLEELGRDAGLVRALRRRHIDLIAEKVEDEARLIELLEYDVDFGQGFLFGEPRSARPAS